MVTLATSQTNRKLQESLEWRVNGFPGENDLKDLRFKLAHNLQSTLDLETALELFFNNTQDLVRTSGLTYYSIDESFQLPLGTQCQHSVQYAISSTNTHLGKIRFTRDKAFMESELTVLEMLIGVLFFPLRNALLYREALQSSMRDTLTGIGNRASMEMSFAREIKLSKRHQQPLTMLLIDVDHFKHVNDTAGHRNGDKTLQHIVKTTQTSLRETDQIFRFGGEEFVAMLHNTSLVHARLIAERIRLGVAMSPINLDNNDIHTTVSIGVSALEESDNADTFFEKTDRALYRAKNDGRNRVICYNKALDDRQSKETGAIELIKNR
ncbi:MAG: GGDEF domain-containing protein [Alteromonadaceae bacterium]|nr:MAG: GGDEF domain-containing protein [Alteromonadaceae bacterium]